MDRLIVTIVRRLDRLFLRMNRASPLMSLAVITGLFFLFCGIVAAINAVAGRNGVLVFGFAAFAPLHLVYLFMLVRHHDRDRKRKLRKRGGNASPKDFATVETHTPGRSLRIWFDRLLAIWGGLFGLLACVEIGIWIGQIPVPPNQTLFDRLWATMIICGFVGALYSMYWPILGAFVLVRLAWGWLWRFLSRSIRPAKRKDG